MVRLMRPALWLGLVLSVSLSAHRVWAETAAFEYTTVTKTATVTSDSTDVTLWDPAGGYGFVLQGCDLSSTVAASIELEVSDVDVVPPIYMDSYGSHPIGAGNGPIAMGAQDAILTYTVTFTTYTPVRDTRVSILCWGYEYRP